MKMKTSITFLVALWFVAFMSLFVAFYVWARDPRSPLGTTLLEITSWLLTALTLILVPAVLMVFLTRKRIDI